MSHILIAVAAILAFVFNFLALQDRSDTTLVAVSAADLGAGQRIQASDVRFVPLDADFAGAGSLVGESDWARFEGWILARPLAEGSVLDVASLISPGSGGNLRSMSIPVSIEHAAGGLLISGDVVDVISVDDGVASFVATDVVVVSVAATDSGGIGSLSSYHLVVSVTAQQALSLAAAIDAGSIELVRATGAEKVEG